MKIAIPRWIIGLFLVCLVVLVSVLQSLNPPQAQSGSFRVNLPAYVYAERGWLYRCEVTNKPRIGGKMDCYLWQWQTPTPEPTQTAWIVTTTPLPTTPAATMTITPTPTILYPPVETTAGPYP